MPEPETSRKTVDSETSVRAVAHGRVNLIGEHTDYNDGFVLPTSIPQSTIVKVRPREDMSVVVKSSKEAFANDERYSLGSEKKRNNWTDYVQGTTWMIAREVGPLTNGFEIGIESTVPVGSGLSSSAALLVALFRAIRDCQQLPNLDDIRISQLCQKVENEFVGARVGIMDPMAASLATENTALFIDTKTLSYERIHIPRAAMEFAVINSGIAHRHSAGSYNQRRSECEKACELLGVSSLREIAFENLSSTSKLPDPLNRRVRHVVTENQRVLEAVEALRQGNGPALGALFKASHLSMRDDYQVSIPEIDELVEIANGHASVFGARLTGGGFGGSVVLAVKAGEGSRVADHVARLYRESTRQTPTVLVPAR